jgi:hypothetical protein
VFREHLWKLRKQSPTASWRVVAATPPPSDSPRIVATHDSTTRPADVQTTPLSVQCVGINSVAITSAASRAARANSATDLKRADARMGHAAGSGAERGDRRCQL